jgi:hypothetical protein
MDKNALVYNRSMTPDRRRYVIASTAALAGLTAILGTAAVGYAGYQGVSALAGGGKKSSSAIPSLPALGAAPTTGTATEAEKARIRKKSKTILTGPLKGDEFGSGPTLLGSGDATKKVTLG